MSELLQKPIVCKHCSGVGLRRLSRKGFWEKTILSRFGYYPWECAVCRVKYYLAMRSLSPPKTASPEV